MGRGGAFLTRSGGWWAVGRWWRPEFLSLSTADALGHAMLCCEGAVLSLQGVQQRPWPLPIRRQQHLPSCDNPERLQTLPKVPWEEKTKIENCEWAEGFGWDEQPLKGFRQGRALIQCELCEPLVIPCLREASVLALLMFSCTRVFRVFWFLLGQKFSMPGSFANCNYTSIFLNTVC